MERYDSGHILPSMKQIRQQSKTRQDAKRRLGINLCGISLSTGEGKQGPSGAISLQTGFSDHSAGGVKLHVGETFGYRNGVDVSIATGLTTSSSMKGGTVRITAGEG
ncbi:hypothetical protein ACHAXN_001930 [Cyclotella atomus]